MKISVLEVLAFSLCKYLYLGQLCVNGANLDIGLGHRWICVGVGVGIGVGVGVP